MVPGKYMSRMPNRILNAYTVQQFWEFRTYPSLDYLFDTIVVIGGYYLLITSWKKI